MFAPVVKKSWRIRKVEDLVKALPDAFSLMRTGHGAATMKRVTLELGGKSPNILLDDADLDKAIPTALAIAFMNSGQACVAGTLLLAPKNRLDAVKQAIRKAIRAFPAGDPADPKIAIGPMVSQKQYERVQSYIRKGIEEGAEVMVGGEGRPEGLEAGYFVKPTVFVNVKNDMTIAREEIFGPVLCVITYDNDEDAIRIANDTSYGLHAYVSGTDAGRAPRGLSDPCRPRSDKRLARRPARAVRRFQELGRWPRIRYVWDRSVSRTACDPAFSTFVSTRGLIKICPGVASSHSREATLETVPMAA